MRVVLYINSLDTGGAERTLVKLANFMAGLSWEVTIVTQQPPELDRFELDAAVQRHSTETGHLSDSFSAALFNNARRIYRLRRFVKTYQPNVVIAFMATANTVATFATRGTGIPVIVSERNYPPALELSIPHRLAQRIANHRAEKMVVLTEDTKRWYQEERGLTRLTVIPNGVTYPIPASTPRLTPDSFINPATRLLLCVGRITQQKQPEVAIGAFASVAKDHPEWHMIWVGRGDTERLQALAEQHGIRHRFSTTGAVGNVQDWYERADAYLLTSAYEGFPNTLLEALACGCASIALDCPTGPAEIIETGKNGLLVDLNNSNALTEALHRIMGDPSLRSKLSQAASDVRQTFSDQASHTAWRSLVEETAHL
ncbi:MAG: glycosyltransferase [Pseudomonadota bacterium]